MKTLSIKAPQREDHGIGVFDLATKCREQGALFQGIFLKVQEALPHCMVTFEIFGYRHSISYDVTVEDIYVQSLMAILYAALPNAEIEIAAKPRPSLTQTKNTAVFDFSLQAPTLIPLKDYTTQESDPLVGLLNFMAERSTVFPMIFQMVLRPLRESFSHQLRVRREIRRAKRFISFSPNLWMQPTLKEKIRDSIDCKRHARLFEVSLRFHAKGKTPEELGSVTEEIKSVIASYGAKDKNSFSVQPSPHFSDFIDRRILRPLLLTAEECATLFHLPPPSVSVNINRVISHKEPAPQGIPNHGDGSVCLFGETNFRNQAKQFGMYRSDRRRHLYVLGKSGVGKSKLIELLIKNDIEQGHGVGVLDPHGDLVDNVLRLIPKERINDVILFDPSDTQFPPALNPLEQVEEHLKSRVCIGFIEIFKKLFGTNWSPRLEHVLRYTTLALLDTPDTTILSILKMLTDKRYRQDIVKNIRDSVVKNFWVNEFAGWSEKFDSEAITPLLNKVGQFVSTNTIRNIVGQPKNLIDFRSVMDTKKILLVKVSKGILGEENAGLLGAMVITKLFQAAMSRADITEDQRADFYFYVDEFQNFATDTFDEILSEARKYRLNLTIANQFLGQLNERVRTTVFGNVGSIISFRVGGADAKPMAAEFTPRFAPQDLINLGVREFITKISVQGETLDPFSGKTLPVTYPHLSYQKECIDRSRSVYATKVSEVNDMIQRSQEITKPQNSVSKTDFVPITSTVPTEEHDEEFSEPLV